MQSDLAMSHIKSVNIPESWIAVLIGNAPSLLFDALILKHRCSCRVCVIGRLPFLRSHDVFGVSYRRIRSNGIWLSLALQEIITLYRDRIVAIVHVGEGYTEEIYCLHDLIECNAIILDPHLKNATANF